MSNAARNWKLVWGCQAQNSWHCGNGVSPVPPHPGPRAALKSVRAIPNPRPEDRKKPEVRIDSHPGGAAANRIRPFSEFGFRPAFGFRPSVFGFQGCRTLSSLNWPDSRAALPRPSPLGEGWGEGKRSRRTDAAAQNVFGPRETEPQFLVPCQVKCDTSVT